MSSGNSDNGIHLVLAALTEIRGTQIEQAEKMGEMRADIKSLSGEEGRVTKIERAQNRQWWVTSITAILAPLIALAGAYAKKLGINV